MALCRQGRELKQKRVSREDTWKASEVVFTFEGVPLDSDRWFVYLGRLLSSDDDDWPAVLWNLVKSWQIWAYISRFFTSGRSHTTNLGNVL
jgi:hypothetical protein